SETENFTFASTLPALLGGSTAYVGFTGATGGANSTQDILNWTFAPLGPPAVPTNLQAQVTGYTAGSTDAVPLGAHLTWAAAAGSATAITLTWTANANNEDGFQIFRSIDAGTFTLLAALPPNTAAAPGTATYTDATPALTPGTRYDYHVQAFNLAGYSDFTGISTATLTLAPTGLSAAARSGQVTLSWSAPSGAVTYNVYRGTTAGGESATPVATGPTALTYT